jgi:hypothetical protein
MSRCQGRRVKLARGEEVDHTLVEPHENARSNLRTISSTAHRHSLFGRRHCGGILDGRSYGSIRSESNQDKTSLRLHLLCRPTR